MSIEKNRALVLKFYDSMSKLDFNEMFDLMAEDGTWTVAGRPETFWHAGVYSKAQRVEAFNSFVKVFANLQIKVLSTTCEDDRVAIEFRLRSETHGGLVYENEMLVLMRCKNSKIVSIYEHLDQQTTLEFERALRESTDHVKA